MDGHTQEALRIEPDTSLPGLRVVRVLDSLRERRETPASIQVDNVLTAKRYKEARTKISGASGVRRDCTLNPSGFHRQQEWHSTIATQGPLSFRGLHCT